MNRRQLLLTGIAGLTTAVAGCSGGDDGGSPDEFELLARADGWEGTAPAAIEGETNPTLDLAAGQEYTLTWENGDGATHDIRIVTGDDEPVASSDEATDQGATVTLEFTASEEMAGYYCTFHPDAMRGDIEISE